MERRDVELSIDLMSPSPSLGQFVDAFHRVDGSHITRKRRPAAAGLQKSFERFERRREAPAAVLAFQKSGV